MSSNACYFAGYLEPKCQLCEDDYGDEFVDGSIRRGPWAIMCVSCHMINGVGLGLGRGQKFRKTEDGRWKKLPERATS